MNFHEDFKHRKRQNHWECFFSFFGAGSGVHSQEKEIPKKLPHPQLSCLERERQKREKKTLVQSFSPEWVSNIQ